MFYLRFGPSEIHHSPGFSRVSRGNNKYILSLGLMNVFVISFARPLTVKNDAWKSFKRSINGTGSFFSYLLYHWFPNYFLKHCVQQGEVPKPRWGCRVGAAVPRAARLRRDTRWSPAPVHVQQRASLKPFSCSAATSSIVSGIALQPAHLLRMYYFQPNMTTCKFVLVLAFSSPIIRVQLAFLWSEFPHVKC